MTLHWRLLSQYVPTTCCALGATALIASPPAAAETAASGAHGQDPVRPFVESRAAIAQHSAMAHKLRANGAMVTDGYYIAIQGAVQQHSNWCVPASSSVTLTHWNVYVSQSTLAAAEHTSSVDGTYLSDVPTPLNTREHAFAYTYSNGPMTAQYVLMFSSEDLADEAPMIIGVQGRVLPYWAAHHFVGLHALTIYANNGSNTVTEWDPLNESWAGAQTITTSVAASAINSGDLGYVW